MNVPCLPHVGRFCLLSSCQENIQAGFDLETYGTKMVNKAVGMKSELWWSDVLAHSRSRQK